jgi:hypothetical protein
MPHTDHGDGSGGGGRRAGRLCEVGRRRGGGGKTLIPADGTQHLPAGISSVSARVVLCGPWASF